MKTPTNTLLSECHEEYVAYTLPEKFKMNKVEWKANPNQMEDHTVYRDDYQKRGGERTKSTFVQRVYKGPSAPFEGESCMKAEFRGFKKEEVERRQPIKPKQQAKEDTKFSGESVYHEQYKEWPASKAKSTFVQKSYEPSSTKLESTTTTRTSYRTYTSSEKVRVSPIKPPTNQQLANKPLDDHTVYRDSYTQKPNVSSIRKVIAIPIKTEDYDKNLSTVQRDDYRAVQLMERTKSLKPNAGFVSGKEDRDFKTESRVAFA